MAGRGVVNEQDARGCLAAARSSRGGLAEWARAHGVDGRSLNAWRVNLGRRGVPRERAVALKVVELVPKVPVAAVHEPYVLHVGGVELQVGADFDEHSLRRLIGLLKSC